MKENNTKKRTRRQFLQDSAKGLGVLTSAGAILSALTSCASDSGTSPSGPQLVQIDTALPEFASLGQTGGLVSLNRNAASNLPENGVFIMRSSQETILVLDRTCTHQACQVDSFASNGIATCPCHGSQFDNEGRVVRGPATRSLRRYDASIMGTVIEFRV